MTATERRWRAQVAAWMRSGLSCKEYAAKAGIHRKCPANRVVT